MSVNNIYKLLQYIVPVAKSEIQISSYLDNDTLSDVETHYKPKNRIVLGKNFFLDDSCNLCGHCCPPETNLYSETEYMWIQKCPDSEFLTWGLDTSDRDVLLSGLHPENYNINGERVTMYRYSGDKQFMYMPKKDAIRERCHWLTQNKSGNYVCKIHPVVSITCEMPHLRILHLNQTVSIGITQFGRNWALGCDVQFNEPKTEEEFVNIKKSRLAKLSHLFLVADDMNIPTYLYKIIEYVKSIPFDNYKEFLGRPIVEITGVKKLF